jgi:uncharacterized RmlC-like cupin family protein
MTTPHITNLNYTYKKPDTDVWVLNTDDIPVDEALIKDKQLVHLAPGSVGGNHRHPRTEWFIGIGELVLVWLDEHGEKHEEHMHPAGQIKLIMMPPFLAHAVVNKSQDSFGILYELADGKMVDVERVEVV